MKEAAYIWKNGEFLNWREATTHVLSHTLHYGNSVFEGIRAYKTDNGFAIFRLQDHINRLLDSAKIVCITPRFSFKELCDASVELIRKNRGLLDSNNIYIRPLIYLGYGEMGVYHLNSPIEIIIAAWEWGEYLGNGAKENGIRVKTSSFARNSIKSSFSKAKAGANYLNFSMAKLEALQCGFSESILLDSNGYVAEGSAECVFIMRNNTLITPPNDNSLESITQNTVIKIAKDLGLDFVQRQITRDEIYISQEAFFVGTAAEITPIIELDGRIIRDGKRGEITKKIQDEFYKIVLGKNKNYSNYLTYI